ncbi:MAG: hypothetical protein GY757_33685, partial [bacterium]|nr:hypothetical protein [bacterium]
MSKRPLESLKSTAAELADLIYEGSQDIEKIEALERELGIIKATEGTEKAPTSPKADGSIGIWKPGLFRGKKCFIRDDRFENEFTYWVNMQRISVKKKKKRVVFLGESVARGFLFDPHFTPASYLGGILKNKSDSGGIEVIDLAKTNMLIHELEEICSSCLALEPDVVTIFAGNNWHNSFNLSKE